MTKEELKIISMALNVAERLIKEGEPIRMDLGMIEDYREVIKLAMKELEREDDNLR